LTFSIDPQPVVVDASVAIEFIGGDARWLGTFDQWAGEDRPIFAPVHFLAEVANAQLVGQRAPPADITTRLERLVATGVDLVDRGLAGTLEAVHLAQRHSLTVYDALYLQLALDTDGELATLDADLAKAGREEGLTVQR
jgi:predicted nucleic acid-binding protein